MVKSTTNFEKFKTITGNREVSVPAVERLVREIKKSNLLPYFPILVNKKMEVIDGQHRLEACKILNVPVYYNIGKNGDIETVQTVNTTSRNWMASDYLHSWIKRGNKHYEALASFMAENALPLGCARRILAWDKGGNDIDGFKKGKFRISSENKAIEIKDLIKEICSINTGRLVYTHTFVIALMKMVDTPRYSQKWMLNRLEISAPKFWTSDKAVDYLRQLEDVYNFDVKREKNKVRFS